ncbi:putative transcriptional regulator [Gynuella sunshinyii YC6258]|uniref:Putative transcriptional regulator n=2 Tax=Gynuella sunshinyii TaxID=1445505 RepID=A0A0C5VFP3_9GAMM|nr:putative transcriptional regulator [Gynuella sunshinyii YC6258]
MAALAAAMSDTSRMKILCALMDGRAWTATELSAMAEIAASTASAHLSRLLKANLVTCLSQGRHRYFRLYSHHIAALLEQMMGITSYSIKPPNLKVPAELLKARTCYDHLAGEIAVSLYTALVQHRWITADGNHLTKHGTEKLLQLGISLDKKTKRKECYACLDWSERKFHLGGHTGALLFQFFENEGWINRTPGYREVIVTLKGRKALKKYFHVEI